MMAGRSKAAVAAALGLLNGAAHAQAAQDASAEIVVTAQKRAQSLQDVPLSIQALDGAALKERNVQRFDDYVRFLPSVTYDSYGPGQAQVYFRGISNGNRLATGSLPTVGVYLDEQPVTTIGSSVDVHIYDIERIEALAGPQGTLFGASSEAGTLRIITNKPKVGRLEGGVDLTGSAVAHGALGGTAEGFVNVPLGNRAAVRLVGFYDHEGGYIDNVAPAEPETFPTSGVPRDNSRLLGKDRNPVDSWGGRAALRVELDDRWTVTPSVIYQNERSKGTFAYKPSAGDLRSVRYFAESQKDYWYQAAAVVEGRVGNFDLTYAFGYFERTAAYTSDYSDYAYFYDRYYESTPDYFGNQFFNNAGDLINPAQIVTQSENFSKQSHELRIASPKDRSLRFVAGLFYQRQTNDWTNLYAVPGLADIQSVTGRPGINYANIQFRVDRDYAVFGEAELDLLPKLTLTGGLRAYRYDNSVVGFFGFNADRSPVGEALCIPGTVGAYGTQRPCDNIDATAKGDGLVHKLTATWRPAQQKLLYVTWSTGFRPGGINRRPVAAPYKAEQLTNYEFGWKTGWFGNRLRVNGALFLEELEDAQFPVTSDQNGITDIVNAGRAESKGAEADVTWLPMRGLSLQASATYVDAHITTDLCKYPNDANDCTLPSPGGNENSVTAPAGTPFPSAPEFKLAATGRYEWRWLEAEWHAQASLTHQSSATPYEVAGVERMPGYESADFSVGLDRSGWSVEFAALNAFDARGQQLRVASCAIEICGPDSVLIYPVKPRVLQFRLGRKF